MHNRKNERQIVLLVKYFLLSLLILSIAIGIAALINIVLSYSYGSGIQLESSIGLLDGIIGAIATGLVLFQLKSAEMTESHQNDIQEASFLLQYNQTFIQDSNMVEVERLLEDQAYYDPEVKEIMTQENRQKFINYLVYLESLAPLVINGVLRLEHIDDLMAYRFFLAVDNAELQEKEIFPFADYYRGCFKLYGLWRTYRQEKGYQTPCEDCTNREAMRALSTWDAYEQFSA